MANQLSSTPSTGSIKNDGTSIAVDFKLYEISLACEVSVGREAGEPVADFAERLIEAIRDRILELEDYIGDIRGMDLDDPETGAS